MKLVVSDTSPLNYLVLINAIDTLHKLFGHVVVPVQVIEELGRELAPLQVQAWAKNPPKWIDIRTGDPSRFPRLDSGEAAALGLALDTHALLLVDEIEARLVAEGIGVTTIGTLGILVEAHLANLLAFEDAIELLKSTSFRVHERIVEEARARIHAREKPHESTNWIHRNPKLGLKVERNSVHLATPVRTS